jgi:hypothetical protein
MDPHAETTPGLALPKPAQEQGRFNAGSIHGTEAQLQPIETAPALAAPPMASPQQGMHAQPVVPAVAQPPIVATQATSVQIPDDNTTALDEEWINKAKAIVEQTKHDPHMESHELSRVKADYLRIRYNKQIKVVEDYK